FDKLSHLRRTETSSYARSLSPREVPELVEGTAGFDKLSHLRRTETSSYARSLSPREVPELVEGTGPDATFSTVSASSRHRLP
ncbi:hypothetical protein, partial [Microbacterium sp. NPDC086615]|uniref:hypothetical protein n=1 Tax=Microbacterium sp. NPDC086615 TaxID=3154865 RepID=UPI003441BFCC